jgi:hypothetical protein
MDKTEIQELRTEARAYFLPFLLGSNPTSHRLASKIYRKYKITCYILDTKRSAADIFSSSSKFLKITESKSSALTAEELIYLAKQCPYTLSILIPCSREYEVLIDGMKGALESSFVISSAEDALSSSPLNVIL